MLCIKEPTTCLTCSSGPNLNRQFSSCLVSLKVCEITIHPAGRFVDIESSVAFAYLNNRRMHRGPPGHLQQENRYSDGMHYCVVP